MKRKFTKQHIKNLSKSHKGHVPWNRGLKAKDDKRVAKNVKLMLQNRRSYEGEGNPRYGIKLNKTTKIKISKNLKGKHCSPNTEFKKGSHPIFSLERNKKISLAKGGTGIARELSEYGAEFDNALKEQVRFRDKYTCQLCGCSQLENGRCLDIHHIDYDKKNNKLINLISLCIRCHPKTNVNHKYWKKHFKEKSKNENFITSPQLSSRL